MEKLNRYIASYKDFPKKGIVFRDALGILQEPEIFNELINNMAKDELFYNADAIISIDARGFIFGTAISLIISKPMIVARKPGKLPGELIQKSYHLEYGTNTLSIKRKDIEKFDSFAIVDDLLATGGTVSCVSEILYDLGKKVTGLAVVVELEKLNGRDKLPYEVYSQIIY